jgi:predicted TIM-barrel fold metal-dependent hydrolase
LTDNEPGIVDADVHNAFGSPGVLKRYLSPKWHTLHDQGPSNSGWPGASQTAARPSTFRNDSWPVGGRPGSDIDLMREQLLDCYDISKAVLHPTTETMLQCQVGELGRALAAATNDWMVEQWLERDARLYGAITVPIEDGQRAAAEISRAAQHPRFVSVTITITTREPLGDPKYRPIFQAAVENGIPVVAHVGGWGGYAATNTLTGEPSYFVERHTNWSLCYAQQLVSLVGSGVFDELPQLKLVLQEGALGWLPPLLWRMDRAWESMRDQLPQLPERPSTTVRRHVWLTTQPLDEPERREHLPQLLDHLDMDDRIMYASDYPHHDFDPPTRVLTVSSVGERRRRSYLTQNANHAFRFPS